MKTKKEQKKQTGITLIALVITIIVLLILAGVGIAALTGKNGLLMKVEEAKKSTEIEGIIENIKIAILSSYDKNGDLDFNLLNTNLEKMDNVEGLPVEQLPITLKVGNYEFGIDGETEVREVAKKGEKYNENRVYKDKTGIAVIPDGFAIVKDADSIENGLVISDIENDNMNNDMGGNQFVWIPVENFEEFIRKDYGNQKISDSDFIDTKPTTNKYYEPNGKNTNNETEKTAKEVKLMYDSVRKNKGFYIARFEAGNENDIAVSKKNIKVYNNIKWGNSATDETGGAVEKSRQMYSGKSTLCYGVQWDAVMKWISKDDELKGFLKDSSEKGNYNNSTIINTGSNSNYQMKNIFDMAGNVYEWTMESIYEFKNYIIRGGKYDDLGSIMSVASRGNYNPVIANDFIGFRVALYV